MSTRKYIRTRCASSKEGQRVEVNICNKAIREVCPQFRYGDRVMAHNFETGAMGKIIGVGKEVAIRGNMSNVLWVMLDKHNGRVSHWFPSGSCFDFFKKVDEEEQP